MVEAKCYFSRSKSLNEKWLRKNQPGTAEAVCSLGSWEWEQDREPVPPHLSKASRADWSPHPGLAEALGHSKPVVMRKAWDQAEILNLKVWIKRGHAKALMWWQKNYSAAQTRGQSLSLTAAPKRWTEESPVPAFFFHNSWKQWTGLELVLGGGRIQSPVKWWFA